MLSPDQRRDLLGLALLALAAFTTLSILPVSLLGETGARLFPSGNFVGVMGSGFTSAGLGALGAGLVLVPALTALGGAACFGWLRRERLVALAVLGAGLVLLLPLGSAVLEAAGWAAASAGAGWLGAALAFPLVSALGWFGAALLLFFAAAALCIATLGWNPGRVVALAAWRGARAAGRLAASAAAGTASAFAALVRRRRERALAAADRGIAIAGAGASTGQYPEGSIRTDAAGRPSTSAAGVEAGEPGGGMAGRTGAAKRRGLLERLKREGLEDPGRPDSDERPTLELLAPPPPRDVLWSERELDRLGDVLIETLRTFKVDGRITGRTTGPVVTQFEVVPAPGIKVNRIASLDADLALALRAPSIRIVAPIPGKGAVGVEVPNPQADVVYVREILAAAAYQDHRGQLPLALGKDLEGRPYVADLARMPHLLIAGATGSGKSVCVNTIITSLIYRHSPRRLRLLMIDPKMVELSIYGALPHLRHPVVTDPRDAAVVLKWAVLEMERRYTLLSVNGTRSLTEFNRRAESGQPMRGVEIGAARGQSNGGSGEVAAAPGSPTTSERGNGGATGRAGGAVTGGETAFGTRPDTEPGAGGGGAHAAGGYADIGAGAGEPAAAAAAAYGTYTEGPLPYIVIVVDELADLIMSVQSDIERPLAQLAQKARAIGIHLIVATQRPSVNVITGLIKANFPSRVAFRVSSKVDSRTILDQNGADALLGNGDMLFLPPGQSDPVRIQGAFMSTEDTERLMGWYGERGEPAPELESDILEVVRAREAEQSTDDAEDEVLEDRDALFRQAAELCIQFQQGSTSLLQRRLRIGYGRAARIIDQLHHAGILGPADGSKAREVLVGTEALDDLGA